MAVKLISDKNDLATTNPALAAQWDYKSNYNLKPTMVSAGSSKKVGWICEKGHLWNATIASRNAGAGCPVCAKIIQGKTLKKNLSEKRGSLDTKNPVLASEWHPTKNGALLPTMVTTNSHEVVWWLGKCAHEWTASVKERNTGHGCPYCSNRKIMPGFNDLATVNPDIAVEWHPDKNGDLLPSDVSSGSSKKVWWRCNKGHEWQAQIKSRSKGSKCPVCLGKKIISKENDLLSIFAQFADEWHPSKNGSLMPSEISSGSHTKVWWLCKNGHEWQTSPNHRTSKNRNCPYCCINPKVLPGLNDLATKNPVLAKEWHPTKNNGLTPDAVTASSSKRVWWKCPKGHEWQTAINHRANGSQCPICSSGMQSSFPEQAIFFYVKSAYRDAINGYTDIFHNHGMELDIYVPSLSVGIEYDGFTWHRGKTSETRELKKYQICKENSITLIRIRENSLNTDKSSCDVLLFAAKDLTCTIKELVQHLPLLSDIDVDRDANLITNSYKQVLSDCSLLTQHPELSREWHPTKNASLTPDMFSAQSNKKVWWLCDLGHEWQAAIDSRVRGTGCPYCSNNKILPGFNDLSTKRPDLITEWNWRKNTTLDPTQIAPGSGKKAWWICKNGHEWEAEISSRNKGHGCPYCAGVRKQYK